MVGIRLSNIYTLDLASAETSTLGCAAYAVDEFSSFLAVEHRRT